MDMLRKCNHCNLEAHTLEDLELFRKNPRCYMGRENTCKTCASEISHAWRKKNGYKPTYTRNRVYIKREKTEKQKESTRKSYKKNWKKYDDARDTTRIRFKDKTIRLKYYRKNVCYFCGKKHPDDLKKQTSLHHMQYHDEDITKDTIELCNSCHHKLHWVLSKTDLKK